MDEHERSGKRGFIAPAPSGVDGETGDYHLAAPSIDDLIAASRGEGARAVPEVPEGVNGEADLAECGWAIVYAANDPTATEARRALAPLLERRARQAGGLYRELVYEPGQSFRAFLDKYRVTPGSQDPERVPGFLLLLGSPSLIPFEIQYLLDIEYAVGRLDFEAPDQYGAYAESVLRHETARPKAALGSREIVYWGPRHDTLTERTSDYLLAPLADGEGAGSPAAEGGVLSSAGYRTTKMFSNFRGEGAPGSKGDLVGALSRARPPAMVFTASHGLSWREGHSLQATTQGAPIAQSWSPRQPVEPQNYVAPSDLGDLSLQGAVVFMFACFGAGTPEVDAFRTRPTAPLRRLATAPFTAALPRHLLAHPKGALAVVSHVDRAWDYFVRPDGMGSHVGPYRKCIQSVLAGKPVGRATQGFSARFSVLSADRAVALDPNRRRDDDDRTDVERAWDLVELNDARSYVLLGDPAVEIRPDLLD